jgi:hypothetical protein
MTFTQLLLRTIVLSLSSIGAAVALWASLPALIAAPQLANWPSVSARLEAVGDSSESSGKGTAPFRVTARYQYAKDGRTYRSERVALDDHLPASLAYQRERYRTLADALARNAPVTAYVNPADPTEAVLTRGLGAPIYFVALVGLALLVVFAVSIWAMWPRRTHA